MPEIFGSEAYSPKEVAERIESVAVRKANLSIVPMFALGVLAGGFIGLGALFSNLVLSDPDLGFAGKRLLAGLTFSLGLILVVVAGAELFTGNNLMVMARVHGKITTRLLLRNFAIVYLANAVGAIGLALLVALSGHGAANGGLVGESAIITATSKCQLEIGEAFFRGVLCNILVCLAVWLAMAGRSVADRIMAVVFPITAFVAAGFEHSIANLYIVPLAFFLAGENAPESLTLGTFVFGNLLPVTLGNLVGGAGMVGLVYHLIYGRE